MYNSIVFVLNILFNLSWLYSVISLLFIIKNVYAPIANSTLSDSSIVIYLINVNYVWKSNITIWSLLTTNNKFSLIFLLPYIYNGFHVPV